MSASRKIRVLIVDDSAVVRRLVREILVTDPEIEIVGAAADPYEARDKIAQLSPDVLTLDLEMPRMDGLTFLALLMERRPLPVVVMSSLTTDGSAHALEAVRLGAVDVIGKPDGAHLLDYVGPQLIAKVKAAGRSKPRLVPTGTKQKPSPSGAAGVGRRSHDPRSIILLGASTGGVSALHEVLTALPADLPGIVVVQHIPAMFSKAFADRLNSQCEFEVREAVDRDIVKPGLALIAPGNFHLLLQWNGSQYQTRVSSGPAIWHQRPAVDLLFKSASDAGASQHTIAGILTGMGRDGADGLLRLKVRGAVTFAQDEATSVVYGMPRAAFENGAAQTVVPLDRIAGFINSRAGALNASPASIRP